MYKIIIQKISVIIVLLLGLTTYAQKQVDSDTFFLLDVDQACVDPGYLLGNKKNTYRNSPKILTPGTFMIFEPNQIHRKDSINSLSELEKEVDLFFNTKTQRKGEDFHNKLMSRIDSQSLTNILKSLLNDKERLETVAKNSYIHVMGFVKIVLVNGPKERNYKVRLHLWWPDGDIDEQKLILEDKHLHKWSFASKMFSGSFEDQLYIVNDVRRDEALKYMDFIEDVEKLNLEDQKKVFDSINVIEAAMLEETKFQDKKFRCSIDKDKVYTKKEIMAKFDLNESDFLDIIRVHENYITLPNLTGSYGLSRIGLKHLSFPVVYEINEGYSYFHHHSIGHRLVSDPDDIVSTFIITAPPINDIKPSILMRSQDGEDITKVAPILTKELLVKNIKRYIAYLEKKK